MVWVLLQKAGHLVQLAHREGPPGRALETGSKELWVGPDWGPQNTQTGRSLPTRQREREVLGVWAVCGAAKEVAQLQGLGRTGLHSGGVGSWQVRRAERAFPGEEPEV